jgi:SpoVK/Ycf46/Vps4 family AAA+-type ATPase
MNDMKNIINEFEHSRERMLSAKRIFLDSLKKEIKQREKSGEQFKDIFDDYKLIQSIAQNRVYSSKYNDNKKYKNKIPAIDLIKSKDNHLIYLQTSNTYINEINKRIDEMIDLGLTIEQINDHYKLINDYLSEVKNKRDYPSIYGKDDDAEDENQKKRRILKENITVTFNDIVGLENAKKIYDEKILKQIKHKELFEKYKLRKSSGILLYGLPGTGKTMFAKAVANELKGEFFSIKSSDLKSM